MSTHPTDGPIHGWFSLSYSNYLVLHRTLLQSMPIEWQERMVACLEELREAYRHIEQPEGFKVEAATALQVSDLDDAQLKQLGIAEDWYRGETPPEGLDAEALREWEAEHESPEGPTYSRNGEEIDGDEHVLLPAIDPVPHYNRGRTYIEPQLPQADGERFCDFGVTSAPGSGCILLAGHQPPNRHVVTPGDDE
ncbi:hypothetical protein [Streptomyces sp. NPDC029554]|uniref:hypothetical protein n=1 Tax=Streptomyces sp. NPDC029554 TaxID=3155126 RepID=UPI0033DA829C